MIIIDISTGRLRFPVTMETIETLETVEVYDTDMRMAEEVESCYTLMEVSTPKKRKKNRTQEDIVDKPKKPRSAYLLYYFDVHQSMQQEYPNLPQSEINKRISESWKRLSVAKKAYYLEKAKLEKDGTEHLKLGPSVELPGFRRILPRASYIILPKSSSSEPQSVSQIEMCIESQGEPGDDCPPSLCMPQHEPLLPALALGSEVELAEQCIAIEGLVEETSTALSEHGFVHDAQSKLLLKASERGVVDGGYGAVDVATGDVGQVGAVVQQARAETAHLLTFVRGQNLLETTSSVGPVVMVPAGDAVQDDKKPYKMAMKTYTRRGRGRCLAPGCSFVYVTRHKPPTCPECGNYLGGKWVPREKKNKSKDSASSSEPCPSNSEANPGVAAVDQNGVEPSATLEPSGGRKAGRGPQKTRLLVQHAVTEYSTLEGSSSNAKPAIGLAKRVKMEDKSKSAVQKRPIRPILPAYCNTVERTMVQFITVPPSQGKAGGTNSAVTVPRERIGGLKASTLKQLGQSVISRPHEQGPCAPADDGQFVLTDNGKYLSVVPLKMTPSTPDLDLGLSTARGRGRCKNPSCDYVYKNRHKPSHCPCCGGELSRKTTKGAKSKALLDPYQALSPAQRELQRQSTVQLLRRSMQIPESEAELQDTLALIQELNSPQVVVTPVGDQGPADGAETEAQVQYGWPRSYESAATHCGLCHYPLFKGGQSLVAGQEDCWLLTETLIQTASLQLKVCLNTHCLALHSFTDLHPGLFNIGNRLLVSLDLFLKIRAKVKAGLHPAQAVRTILDPSPSHPVHALSPEESSQVYELMLSGFWAVECLTVRDYNDMICGVCGIAPKVEIAQRHTHDVLQLSKVEFTWPEFTAPEEVNIDDFWLTMESEAIEQAVFPSDVPITRVDASIIAPFIPPLMRSPAAINTEKDKALSNSSQQSGEPSFLVRLIHEGQLRPEALEEHSEEELRAILHCCGESAATHCTKDELLVSLISLYTRVQSGLPTAPPPPPHLTAGKLSKVCPHQVVCGSKYLVRGETARDHLDLLLSSRYWPPVYVTDAARPLALCADMQYPGLACQMWGRNQGCFSDPMEEPEYVSCAELQDQPYAADLCSLGESPHVHPVTKSSSRWLVHPAEAPGAGEPPALQHHSMGLCKELEPYAHLGAELGKDREEGEEAEEEKKREEDEGEGQRTDCGDGTQIRPSDLTEGSALPRSQRQPLSFNSAAYYYLYNRLADFLSSREIVGQQISEVLKACQPGEVVIRDSLYRLGVAQINTQGEGLAVELEAVEDRDTVYEEEVLP